MNVYRNSMKAFALSSLLLVPALAGCSDDAGKKEEKTEQNTAKTTNKDIKQTAQSLKKMVKTLDGTIEAADQKKSKEAAETLNNEWLAKENNIRETYPLLYTEVEKYMQPLYMEATKEKPDQSKMKDLSGQLDTALDKLANAKESEEKSSEALTKAVSDYKQYVDEQMNLLVASTKSFVDSVKAKDSEKAKQYYVESRTYYERVEPIAESFGDLDPKIDAREGDVEASEWGGFHRIEKALWQNENLEPMAKVADTLNADVLTLQQKVKDIQLKPTQIVAGSMELINEAAISKITGEEEHYSHVDLMDLAANVDGSQAVYHAILPALNAKDPELSSKLDQQFNTLNTALAQYRKNDQFILYTELTKEQVRDLSQKLGVLAEYMGKTAQILQ
ncbi:iron uptake system protein EfeO [Bacillus testis]|uniref:iron uptake system protein EfeO n=1 Tax=Bacillus testis TaxID=1622072 RepID=UPI00067EB3A8|nr:iron uptake system protein EfeO [Bacillus testis]